MFKKIAVVVLDSLGVGNAIDEIEYGDTNANTLLSVSRAKKLNVPNLINLGLSNFKMEHYKPPKRQIGYTCDLQEISNGKDTLTGHWEMMGIKSNDPFVTFTDTGFPDELIILLEKFSGRKVVGNIASSGTDIIKKYGLDEINDNKLIVYTSSDSVLQICGHEKYMGLDKLMEIVNYAREITMKKEWMVGRVIARPYLGENPDEFVRTANRKDLAIKPTGVSTLAKLVKKGYDSISVGKIYDIFSGLGITKKLKGKDDCENMDITIDEMKKDFKGLIFTNLVDFDSLYGHRRDPIGYANNLELVDKKIGQLINNLKDDELVIFTADHGNDPAYSGTNHTRENVPFIAYSPKFKEAKHLGTYTSFATIDEVLAENFGIESSNLGEKILGKLK